MIRRPLSTVVADIVWRACIDCRLQSLAVVPAFDCGFLIESACREALKEGRGQ